MGGDDEPTTLLLADPNALLRDIVEALCRGWGIEVVGHVATGWELSAMCKSRRPRLVLSATMLSDGPIDEYVEGILSTGAKLIILCDSASDDHLTALMTGGAVGYIVHDTSPNLIAEAFVSVLAGTGTSGTSADVAQLA